MQNLLVAAGVIACLTAIVHSVMGELLIFRHLRRSGVVPSMAAPPLQARNIRILWATWHLASVFGVAFALVLLQLAPADRESAVYALVVQAIVLANFGGALLVLVATRARHPGWIALLLVAVLTAVAARAS